MSRLCFVQLFCVIGDIARNFERIRKWCQHARAHHAGAVFFPECALTGYLPLDLLLRPDFISQHAACLDKIRALSADIDIFIGSLDHRPLASKKRFYNAYHHFSEGRLIHSVFKTRLPDTDVFCESRYCVPNPAPGAGNILTCGALTAGVAVCEDMWYDDALFEAMCAEREVAFFICPSASPYHVHKAALRKDQMRRVINRFHKPFVWLNQVGSFDGVLFDGHSYIIGANQKIIGQMPAFKEHALMLDFDAAGDTAGTAAAPRVFDLPQQGGARPPQTDTAGRAPHHPQSQRRLRVETLAAGLEFGTRNFILGSGLNRALICVSGGVDSALALIIAKKALGADNCFALILPSQHNKHVSTLDAIDVCQRHQISFRVIPIAAFTRPFLNAAKAAFGQSMHPVVPQNLQARARGVIAMMYANQTRACLIGASNKSELAMGYATLYGDLCAGIMPLGDLLKCQIYSLIEHYARAGESIPERVIRRAPSAELACGQKDEDDLPPYHDLDPALAEWLTHEADPHASFLGDKPIYATIMDALKHSQFKRAQCAPIIKVSDRDLGRGRRAIISGGSIMCLDRDLPIQSEDL